MLRLLLLIGVLLAGAAWFLSAPRPLPEASFAGLLGNATRGQTVFWAAGCASCHMAEGATGDAQLVLAGGKKFPSDFGTFIAPNISQDKAQGIGAWTVADLGNALMRGVGRGGEHLYPALPYASYTHMARQDVADLYAFLQTLPADATPSAPHDLGFPFNIRRSLGFWKLLFLKDDWVLAGDLTAPEQRGRMIVEGLAHCGECHTPRNLLGGMQRGAWLSGAPNPSGKGTIPNITPGGLEWSEDEIVEYLTTGFTPDFDSAGGLMAEVVENMARLPDSDRAAVAAYLKRVPAVVEASTK
jgi:mono/diheme cytochrome c family protein